MFFIVVNTYQAYLLIGEVSLSLSLSHVVVPAPQQSTSCLTTTFVLPLLQYHRATTPSCRWRAPIRPTGTTVCVLSFPSHAAAAAAAIAAGIVPLTTCSLPLLTFWRASTSAHEQLSGGWTQRGRTTASTCCISTMSSCLPMSCTTLRTAGTFG